MLARCGFVSALVMAALALGALAREKAQPKTAALEQAARAFVEQLNQGAFAKATQNFDATMLKVMPPEELKKTWQKTVGPAGAFKKLVGTRAESKDKYDFVYVTSDYAKARFDVGVVFDKDAKIAGLQITPVAKPAPTGAEAIYEGTLEGGARKLRLAFHLFQQPDGSYEGTMDSPDQGAKGLALDEVSVQGDAVRLAFSPTQIVYEGQRSKDDQEIAGTLTQGGRSSPMTLQRVAKASEANRPQHPTKPYPYDEIEVAYENKPQGIKLAGTLTLPRSNGPFPAVLLITGSGAQDRDETLFGHKPFLVLADYLTRRGIAVLRVDDRGVGGSTGSVANSTTADFAEDVLAGVAFLKGRKEINARQIGLIGHSEGGIIAPLVASRSKDIAFIVLLAGTGVPGHEIFYTQSAAGLKLAGTPPETLALLRTLQDRLLAAVRAEKDSALAEKRFRTALEEVTSKVSEEEKQQAAGALAVLEVQAGMVLSPWGRFFLDYDPRPALRKVSCPVLALNGAKDVQVDAKLNLPVIEAALKEAGNKDVTIREFPNQNHLFQTCQTGAGSEYGAIEETLAPAVLEAVADWIAKRTGDQGPAASSIRPARPPTNNTTPFRPAGARPAAAKPGSSWSPSDPAQHPREHHPGGFHPGEDVLHGPQVRIRVEPREPQAPVGE
jgi:pimeloyl-ACP methyl ester carboxylesterase